MQGQPEESSKETLKACSSISKEGDGFCSTIIIPLYLNAFHGHINLDLIWYIIFSCEIMDEDLGWTKLV